MTDIKVTPNALPLPLRRLQSERPASNALPLPLNRKLGTLEPVIPDVPPVKRTMLGASIALMHDHGQAVNISQDNAVKNLTVAIAQTALAYRQAGINVGNSYWARLLAFYPLANGYTVRTGDLILIGNRIWSHWENYVLLGNATQIKVSDTIGYASVLFETNAKVASFESTLYEPLQPAINLANGLENHEDGVLIGNRHRSRTQAAIPVPCRYYPIPEAPPPPVQGVCQIRPPSSRLPLPMTRRRGEHPSSALPLPLLCWHDQSPEFIPSLESYIVLNTVTATIGGIAIDPIDFNIKADINGYCWQGGINLTTSQYEKIKAKLEVERGNEPTVIINVNGKPYAFLAEDITRNRQFGKYTYNISGRSATAQLGQDYAHAQGGMIDQDLYASQIINMQLADLPFTIDRFEIQDWLIPANTLSVTNKTPIAVIGEIAKACGGFVVTDTSQNKLSILPKWRKPAWELATAVPDVVIPMDVVKSIGDKKDVNPRYNTVTLVGGREASEIYRNRQGRDRIAPIDNNALYTDRDCVVAKGIQILSDSGTHGSYTLKMRIADKYNIALANLSDVWQINDTLRGGEGSWKGIVTGVSLDVSRDNDAIVVWQTVTIDRYLDV